MDRTHEQGAMMIESLIVFACVVLVLVFILFTAMVQQQGVALSAAVQREARRLSCVAVDENYMNYGQMDYIRADFASVNAISRSVFTESDPYRYLFPKQVPDVTANVRKYVGNMSVFNTDNLVADATYENHLLYTLVTVKATQTYQMPLGLGFIGLDNTFEISASSTAVVCDPDEFVRNLDMVWDYAQEIGEATGLTDKMGELADKVKKVTTINIFGTKEGE